eukprot:6712145-Alexandrium_andersonii.AAC.1
MSRARNQLKLKPPGSTASRQPVARCYNQGRLNDSCLRDDRGGFGHFHSFPLSVLWVAIACGRTDHDHGWVLDVPGHGEEGAHAVLELVLLGLRWQHHEDILGLPALLGSTRSHLENLGACKWPGLPTRFAEEGLVR